MICGRTAPGSETSVSAGEVEELTKELAITILRGAMRGGPAYIAAIAKILRELTRIVDLIGASSIAEPKELRP